MERSDDEMIKITKSRSFQDLCPDVLVRIFMFLNVVNLMVVSMVCKSWNNASRDPTLWFKVDLTKINTTRGGFDIPRKLNAWSSRDAQARMARFLKNVLDMSNFNTKCLIFNIYIHLSDELLKIAAERTPNLKRLVLAHSGRLTKRGIEKAMASWKMLESITITSVIKDHSILFCAIGKFCHNIVELKVTCDFEEKHADDIIKNTPNIRALSIRNVMVNKDALYRVLNSLQHLKVVNVCHSLFWDATNTSVANGHRSPSDIVGFLKNNVKLGSWRGQLLYCVSKGCCMCNPRKPLGDDDPLDPFEELWSNDEIPSLSY